MGARTVVSTSRFSFWFPGQKETCWGSNGGFHFPIRILVSGGKKRPAGPRTVVSTSYFEFSFPGAKKGLPEGSLWEIVISLSCEQNSARKFQSGVSNSGAQIPKHARQNSEVTENSCFKNRWRGLRILDADFSILVSAFEFPSGAGIWDASHFRFLDSRCKSRVGDGQEMTPFPVSDSDFPILGANPGSVKGRRLHHSRFRILISRFPVQNRPSPHGVSGEFISRFLIPLSLGT